MVIAIFTDTYLPNSGGVVKSIINSTGLLAQRGHKILIFTPSVKDYLDQPKENVKVFRFNSISLTSYENFKIALPNLARIIKIIKTEKPSIVHILSPATMGIAGIICARMMELPVLGTFHTLFTEVLTYVSIYRLFKIDKLIDHFQTMIIEQDGNSADSRGNNFISHLRQLEKIINKLKGLEIKERNGKLQKEILWNILIWIYNKCIIVTAPSRTLIEELKNKGIKTKLIYLSNGLDRNKFKPKKEYKAKSFKILHVGRLGYEKNVDVLIKAMPFILKDFPQTKLTIVGDGPALNSLAILVKQLNLGDSVIFTGFITNNELPTIFRKHDIFVTASTMETQGLVILESMSCGLPVIGIDKYAVPDLVKNNVNGFTVKPFDYKEIAAYVRSLFENRGVIEELGRNSVLVVRKHDIIKVIDELEDIYNLAIDMYEMRKGVRA